MNKKNRITLFLVLSALTVALFLQPQLRQMHQASRRAASIKKMRSINSAIKSHASDLSRIPTLYLGAHDARHHSWRSTIQPYLNEGPKTSIDPLSIDPFKPWDDPANAEARETSVANFRFPGSNKTELKTRYLSFDVSSGVLKPGARGRKVNEVNAGGSRTTPVIIEVPQEEAVHWMSPVEFDTAMLVRLKTKYPTETFTVVFFDDSVQELTLVEIENLVFKGISPSSIASE